MLNMALSHAANITDGRLLGDDKQFTSVAIDSRLVQKGGLFVAIKGEKADGHDYLHQAMQLGAVAALVERPVDQALPQIIVSNVVQALAKIAREYREQYKGIVFSITGSSGKTSTKEMLVSILSTAGSVVATKGNRNNEIGVPLTIFGLDEQYPFAVVEMGAAQQGDIAYLMQIAVPDVVAITNVGSAHVGRFGSEAVIATTKAEIYSEAVDGARAVVNLDDKYAKTWLEMLVPKAVRTFSLADAKADIHVSEVECATDSSAFTLHIGNEKQAVLLPVPGLHNISNALCAAACAYSAGLPLNKIVSGLNGFSPVSSRLQKLAGCWGGVLIDDCYNANPGSVRAAIDVLANYSTSTILILGDMAELGEASPSAHAEVGQYAKLKGVGRLMTCGRDSKAASDAFGENALHFDSKKSLIEYLPGHLAGNDVVLIKGSRSAALEEIVQAIIAKVPN